MPFENLSEDDEKNDFLLEWFSLWKLWREQCIFKSLFVKDLRLQACVSCKPPA